jgi:membrane-bound ClpP family serine protease
VFIHGELWQATASSGSLPAGARVRVVRVRDLVVDVEPIDAKG